MPQVYTPGQSNAYHLSRRIASQAAHEQMRNYSRAHQRQRQRQMVRQNIHNSLAPGPYDRWDLIPQSQQPSLRPGLSNQPGRAQYTDIMGRDIKPSGGWLEHLDYSKYGGASMNPGTSRRTTNKPRTRRKLRPTQMPKKVKSSAPRRKKGMRNRPY